MTILTFITLIIMSSIRITSYNVCYTKLLRERAARCSRESGGLPMLVGDGDGDGDDDISRLTRAAEEYDIVV